ncbi:ATP-binding cassette domain-containing protein [Actibacterium mucosum]|nr:ATP-binding cassette domain-containing protein [Actibacterium mucosum]
MIVGTVFLFDLVALGGQAIFAKLLGAGIVVAAIGALAFEFGHTKALSGLRMLRTRFDRGASAVLAVGVFGILEIVHPLLGLAIPSAVIAAAGAGALFQRFGRAEPMWDFRRDEASSIFAGRDASGLKLAALIPAEHPMLAGCQRISGYLGMALAFAVASYLAAIDAVNTAAVPAVSLLSMWATFALTKFVMARYSGDPLQAQPAADVSRRDLALTAEEDEPTEIGLRVAQLDVSGPRGKRLLSTIDLVVDPGTVTCIAGEGGAGKSLLLKAIAAPYDLPGLQVEGQVDMNGQNLWQRGRTQGAVPAYHMSFPPILLPASGAANLTGFHDDAFERGFAILEQLVFSAEIAHEICITPDARNLSSSHQAALAIARGFLMAPSLYLLDRPEDGCDEGLIGAICERIAKETRLGRSFLIISNHRKFQEISQKTAVMQNGNLIDFGDTEAIRTQLAAGWASFSALRTLESDENLTRWIAAQFRRNGDDGNRRKVSSVAGEMLVLSSKTQKGGRPGMTRFKFKHFKGHCVLTMRDDSDPLTPAQVETARKEAQNAAVTSRLSPLAAILSQSLDVEIGHEFNQRVVSAKIETYDPRLTTVAEGQGDVETPA